MSLTYHGFSVPFRFPVSFTRGAWAPGNSTFVSTIRSHEPTRRHRVLVVLDDQVARTRPRLADEIEAYVASFAGSLELVARPMLVPGGETSKNDLTHCYRVIQAIHDLGLDRQSFVTVIGGGAVLDMASFAAAIAHRGIRVVRFPTTVLAQADSGIAVKNGLNLFGKKNFIGTFVPPFAVINDLDFLSTLGRRDRIAGLSEAVKVAALRDPEFFGYLETHALSLNAGAADPMAHVVQRAAELHLAHICGNGDPFELGSARPLDFGHWAAHKLEAMTQHRLRHGEAVAIGIALDVTYAVAAGHLDEVSAERLLRLLEALGFRLWDDALTTTESDDRLTLLHGLQEFREHLGGELHVTLLKAIGHGFEVTEMDETLVAGAIETLAHRRRLAPRAAAAVTAVR